MQFMTNEEKENNICYNTDAVYAVPFIRKTKN